MEKINLPQNINVKKESANEATITIEPCYPGYGTTLGNALRRVLLSSLPGAAITAAKIKDIQHEFSTIPYVKEDVISIILNLKLIRFKLHSDQPIKLNLKTRGEKVVRASDIKTPAEVEIVNPRQPIATLTDKAASLEMELTVEKGRGYVPVENREKEKLEIGTIAIDAIYTPIKNVNFRVEHVRVEQFTNYDKLLLSITTDGTISPVEALKMAASLLVEHFSLIEKISEGKKEEGAKKDVKAEVKAGEETVSAEKEKKKKGRPKKSTK